MTDRSTIRDLEAEHRPEAIRRRLRSRQNPSHIGDAVLGGIDGCVTTFAIVAGAAGGGLSSTVVIILGVANLLADGFSMAVSNYQSAKSERQLVEKIRRMEQRHIRLVPDGEREEIRQIYRTKGFNDHTLEAIVETITSDEELWINTMLMEEHGMQLRTPSPSRAALVTFFAFLVVGFIPLIPYLAFPYLLPGLARSVLFPVSAGATAVAFLLIGFAKGHYLERAVIRGGLETLVMGGAAAGVAYVVGAWLRASFGAA